MAKRSHRRRARREEEGSNGGCVWGLIRMLYFRRDARCLLDRSRRCAFKEIIAAKGRSKKKSRGFDELDEEDTNMEECSGEKPTVKKLMDDELHRLNLLKKLPNHEVERMLRDLGHDACLDKTSMAASDESNHCSNSSRSPLSRSVDPGGSKSINQPQEQDLELVLADFLGEIYRYHSECPHGDCKNKSDLCPALKSLIHKKLNDLSNHRCYLDNEQAQESKDSKIMDALEILISDKELFLKLLQKPNSDLLENMHKCQNKRAVTMERTNAVEETGTAHGKESKHMFFWKKDRSNRRQASEGTEVSRIVVLKPSPRSLHHEPSTLKAQEHGEREVSKFSIKEVTRRFRLVSGGTPKDPVIAIKKGPIKNHTNASKDASVFYEEAKKHLTEILNDRSQDIKFPDAVLVSRSLGGMLSLPECSVSSPPRSSTSLRDCLDLSFEETKFALKYQYEKEETSKDRSQSMEDPECVASDANATVDKQAGVEETRWMEEEATQEGAAEEADAIKSSEGPDELHHSELLCNDYCNPTEQCRDNLTLGTQPERLPSEIFPNSPQSIVEMAMQQDWEAHEGSHDKQEQPSPLSVLDSFLKKDMDTLDCNNTKESELHEDSPEAGIDLRISWEDKNMRSCYIKSVLELSGLCTDRNSQKWYLQDELVDLTLFDVQTDQIDDLKLLLFDCICEAVTMIKERYFVLSPHLSFLSHKLQAPPVGGSLIYEVNRYVDKNLLLQLPSSLDQTVRRSLEKDQAWMDLRSQCEVAIVEISEFLLDELVDEVSFDLWI